MSRAIKFRAWDGRSIRYDVTGFEHGRDNEMVCVFLNGDCYAIGDRSSQHPNAEVMQFTGLTDRNGVDVYESDVVRDGDVIGIVEYVSDSAAFIVDYSGGAGRWLARLDAESETTEVIGNIHEHPELLEAKP